MASELVIDVLHDPAAHAIEMGLRYVKDVEPGFQRVRRGKGFVYLDHQRNRVNEEKVLHRIHSLVLPPAWGEVWICKHANGHLQATGRDDRKRKQYRYHPTWSEVRNETKFGKLSLFGEILPDLRKKIEADFKQKGMSRNKVLAGVVKVIEETHLRVGNDIYAEENESYGLTTIHNNHVKVFGDDVKFKFKGKSGVIQEAEFHDARLGKLIKNCQELPGEELFAYEEDGKVYDVSSDDVNQYLREISGHHITAKDFRTWAGTVSALEALYGLGQPEGKLSERARKSRELVAIRAASESLRNTVAVCRKYYVHPAVFQLDRSGELQKTFQKVKRRKVGGRLSLTEQVVLDALKLGAR